jgi:Ca-activated chloride channel family protein
MKAGVLNFSSLIFRGHALLLVLLIVPLLSFAQTENQRSTDPTKADEKSSAGQRNGSVVINTDLVTTIVTVTDNNGIHISGLDKNAFRVYDDQRPQEISFFSDADSPVSLGVVFDVSNSMTGEKIRHARDGLLRFVETSHRADEYFVISVNDRAQLLLDRTADAESMLSTIIPLRPQGETALYDAIYLGLEKVSEGRKTKRALLLITDGIDTTSRFTLNELRRSLQESDVIVYAIGILGFSRTESVQGRSTLSELAGITGGKAFFPASNEGMIAAFEQIALEMRAQYSIGFRASDLTGFKKWHRLKVDLVLPERSRIRVRTRRGFFAP